VADGGDTMDELKADLLARTLGGQAYVTDDDAWVVVIDRRDGKVVILTDESVEEYADWQAFKAGHRDSAIRIR
jgi:hypothetical protein